MGGIADFFSKNTPLLMDALEKGKVEMAGPPAGIYYTWDEKKMESDMAVAVPIKRRYESSFRNADYYGAGEIKL
ncbi:MAG: hypothetical protein IPP15_12705 [Saprospiraceae bacterium]|uniref:Uncharacterized protein n=1 Tax=Candidatus Opimibacter skivensis TaxID=2982028 RepID=A0A9D7XQP9_9BACT|nr:hypothetical protein [Candidatus Opimibacter skivensis]